MIGIDILVLVAPFVIPFLIGQNVASKKRGLIPLLALPILSIAVGAWLIVSGRAMNGSDATPTDFATVWFIVVGLYLAFVFAFCWMLGRLVRNRKQRIERPITFVPPPLPSQSIEANSESDDRRPLDGQARGLSKLDCTLPKSGLPTGSVH
jgi:hypothetical protein